jgi:transitional endoplasmic reticulum ATPase
MSLDWLSLSHATLLALFVLPFSVYAYSASFWYMPARVKLFNLTVSLLSVLAIVLTLAKLKGIVFGSAEGAQGSALLALLHMGPPLLALCAAWLSKSPAEFGRRSRESAPAYTPQKLNQKVEKLGWDELVISEDLKRELISVVELLKDSKTAARYGIQTPKGILLSGPPGTGKTTIARVMASDAGLNFFAFRPDEIVSKWVGDSEKNLTRLFETAQKQAPAVIFIDEIDAIGKKRSDSQSESGDGLLNHLLQLMDGVVKTEGLYIIAATNRPDLVDDALKRAGRLNRVIEIPRPDDASRRRLFELYLAHLHLESDVDLEALSAATAGNSAADIKEICNQAGLHAYKRESSKGKDQRDFLISSEDIEAALSDYAVTEQDLLEDKPDAAVSPVPLNKGIERVTWDDVIIDPALRQELQSVVDLLKDPATAKNYGIDVPKGILLNGPPGTGKTTIAKIIASTAELSFFVLKMDEVISKWVGESEKNLTRLFKAAAKHAPAVIFIDEVDSIAKNRSEGNAQHADNLLNHLLQLIDGVITREGIYIIAATNRADLVDPALKRGGRLNKVIEIPLPSLEARQKLFSLYLAKLKLREPADVLQLARRTNGKAAADIRTICNQAGLNAFKRESARGSRDYVVEKGDLESAFKELGIP